MSNARCSECIGTVASYSRVSTITGSRSIPVIRPRLCEDRLGLRWVLADNDNDMRPVLAPFVLEARRRGLLKVATAYLIVTWLVLEIGHTLFLIFDLPHGALQFIFVLLALGFPMMLVAVWHEAGRIFSDQERAALAWAEEVTRLGDRGVGDGAFEAAAAAFGEKQLVDLTLAIAVMNAYNRMAISFRATPIALAG